MEKYDLDGEQVYSEVEKIAGLNGSFETMEEIVVSGKQGYEDIVRERESEQPDLAKWRASH